MPFHRIALSRYKRPIWGTLSTEGAPRETVLSAAAAITAAVTLLVAEAVVPARVAVLAVIMFRRGELLFRLADQAGRELIAGIRLQIGRILIDSLGETCDVSFQAIALVEQIAARVAAITAASTGIVTVTVAGIIAVAIAVTAAITVAGIATAASAAAAGSIQHCGAPAVAAAGLRRVVLTVAIHVKSSSCVS